MTKKASLPMAQVEPSYDLSAYLPLDYQVFSGKAVMQYISAAEGRSEAFIAQTQKKLVAAKSPRSLVGVTRPDWGTAPLLAGLIFHSSRCGSTLLCNMLDSLADCYVVRESPVLNKVLLDRRLTPQQRHDLFHTILIAYSRYAAYLEKRCVIKFTSFCTLQLGFIREQLPQIPWLYLHREPRAVIRSLMKNNAGWQRKGSLQLLLNLDDEEMAQPLARLTARVLQDGFRVLLDSIQQLPAQGSAGLVFNYERLIAETPQAMSEIAQHLGFGFLENELHLMLSCLQSDSKTGQLRDKPEIRTEVPAEDQDGISTDMQLQIEQASLFYCQAYYERLRRFETAG
jgi:hypothetical protein